MAKKSIITIVTILAFVFSFTYVFANDGMMKDAVDGVRNVVAGAENKVEDAAKDVSNMSKDATGDIENAGENAKNDMKNMDENKDNNANDDSGNIMPMGAQDNGGSYSATRTSAETPTFMGMTSTAWTWLILGIAAIVIVGLVWYYSMQMTRNNYNDGNDN